MAFNVSAGMPHNPSGGGSIGPPIAPFPWPMMSMNAWRSNVNDIARLRSGLSKGGAPRLTMRLRLPFTRKLSQIASGTLSLDVLKLRKGDAEIDVGLAGDETQEARRYIPDDRPFNAVDIGSARFPVIGAAGERDRLVWLKLDEFERAGADRMLPHVARRHMTGVDRRPSRCQQGQKRGLRPLEVKGDLEIAVGGYGIEIVVPGFARVDA